MKVLECSSKGDKRFSAFYAKIQLNGRFDSVENHYQLSKRFGYEQAPRTWRDAKGRKPTHFMINGSTYPKELLGQWYSILWAIYLDRNPDLTEYARQFDGFNDQFRGKSINCQADVIEIYVKEGRETLLSSCEELLSMIKENNGKRTTN
jgi:hypothetical protein